MSGSYIHRREQIPHFWKVHVDHIQLQLVENCVVKVLFYIFLCLKQFMRKKLATINK